MVMTMTMTREERNDSGKRNATMTMTRAERDDSGKRNDSLLCRGELGGGETRCYCVLLSSPAYKVSSYLYERQVHNHMNEEKGGEKEKGSGLV